MPDPNLGDLGAFADDVQKMATQGGFDPFAMFASTMSFHSVFLAPFSPSLAGAIAQFLADGTGPLLRSIDAFRAQGMPEDAARMRAREMFAAAKGMCVVVLSGDSRLNTIPQLFFGHLEDGWRAHVVEACGKDFPGKEALRQALGDLAAKAAGGTSWPALTAGPDAGSNVLTYWLELASGVVASLDEGLLPTGADRLGDLGHWIGVAVALLAAQGKTIDVDDLAAVARCRLLAGEWREAGALIEAAVAAGLQDEELVDLIGHFATAAARANDALDAAEWLEARIAPLEETTGRCYDLTRALFTIQAAAQAPTDRLLATAALMLARDKKSFRHDLTREPVWAVRAGEPGDLLDTAAAATAIGRSATFVSKRLEQGTIPSYRQGEQVRIPARALASWKALMDAHKLLE